MGVSPGRDTGCAESMSTPGETVDVRKVCVPRRDYRCAEDGCSPDETIYCVYWIMIVYDWLKC